MELVGIGAWAVGLMTQTTSLFAAITSSAYNHRRILRETQKSCEEIDDCLRRLKDMIALKETSVTSWEHLDSGLQKCQVLIDQASSATTHSSFRMRAATRMPDSATLMQLSESLEARCQREEVDGLVLWRLQSWITVSPAPRDLESPLTMLSETYFRPSATVGTRMVHENCARTVAACPLSGLDHSSCRHHSVLCAPIRPSLSHILSRRKHGGSMCFGRTGRIRYGNNHTPEHSMVSGNRYAGAYDNSERERTTVP
jgi:hypothetical protein